MSPILPRLFLVRHGNTAWSDSGQHTGRTDLPLNQRGEQRAAPLGALLQGLSFARVFTSPLQRASKTCALAGFDGATVDADLVEWDYGRFEGKRTKEILQEWPSWQLFRDGCPEGEGPSDVATRADHFITQILHEAGDVLAFSSGHLIRMVAARWLGLPPAAGRFFFCRPASVGVLAFEHNRRDERIVALWNYVHPEPASGMTAASLAEALP